MNFVSYYVKKNSLWKCNTIKFMKSTSTKILTFNKIQIHYTGLQSTCMLRLKSRR